MRKAPFLLVVLLAVPSLAVAGSVEISGFAGYTFPFYSQTFRYDPGPVSIPIPDVSVQQNGVFQLKASGGAALGGSLAFFPVEAVGFELRVDRASVTVKPQDASFDVNLTLPAPLDPVKSTLSLPAGSVALDSGKPLSLNLKLRSTGRAQVFLSGGISRLGNMNFSLRQNVAIGVSTVNLQTGNLEVATIDLRATPSEQGSRWGGNLGLGFQLPLGEHGGLVLEGRGFYFPKQAMTWEPIIETPLGTIQSQLLQRLLDRLEPVEFKPWWVQATIGISYRF
jgi:hypothetical protein